MEPGLIWLQVKATDYPQAQRGTIAVRLGYRDVVHWIEEPYPVIRIVYGATQDRAFWLHMQKALRDGGISSSPNRVAGSLSMSPWSKWSMKKRFANSAASRFKPRPRGRKEGRTMPERVTYGQLREVLLSLGFKESRRGEGIGFEHPESDTLFLFRSYKDADKVQPAEVFHVRELLDARALLGADSFDRLLTRAPA
jgi:hypothetical protein